MNIYLYVVDCIFKLTAVLKSAERINMLLESESYI